MILSSAVWSAVCSPFLFVCLTVPQWALPLLLLRTNSLHFLSRVAFSLSDVYVVLVIYCHSSSTVVLPWLGLQSWQECSPTGTWCRETVLKHKHLTYSRKSENTSMAPQKTGDRASRIPFLLLFK